jgi:plasmid stabilization system protein ParE
MKISIKDSFRNRLLNQVEYIAQDSPRAARRFHQNIFKSIRDIAKNPYQCRKSIFFDDANIRDLIFKGYVIVFRINKNEIEVFGFVKYQTKPYD